MERMTGHPIPLRAVVHHKNGIKDDNDPLNLELHVTHGDHMREHHQHKGNLAAPKGENHGMAKMTSQAVALLRAKYSAGEKQSALAGLFSISRSQVNNIVHGRQWNGN
jgi:hypothetical protein